MQALAAACLLVFVATVSVVGVRLLLLARRTRGRHEFLIGTGMVLVGAIGFPGGLVSGFGRPVGEMSISIWFATTLVTQIGIAAIYAFTWQVFRPSVWWGKAIVALGCLFMLGSLLVSWILLLGAPPEADSQQVARDAISVGLVGYGGCFLWSAIEGLLQWRTARRRLALGLADALVVNRFLLWGVFGLAATGINATSAIGNAIGADPSTSPLVLVPMGVLGALASVAVYLAFLPPASYVERIRARSVAA